MLYHSIRMNGYSPVLTNGTSPTTASGSPGSATGAFVALLRAMADPMRLRLVRLLEQPEHAGLNVGELAHILRLPQSTVSRHLKMLCETGIAGVQREGTSMLYRLSSDANQPPVRQLRSLCRRPIEDDRGSAADLTRLAAVLRRRSDAGERFFDKAAWEWDAIRRQWFGELFHLEALLAFLNPAWTVGDLGAGTGAMLGVLSAHVRQVMGVEPAPAMLKAARARVRQEKLDNVQVLAGGLENLPLDSASLDAALVMLVLHHVANPATALLETARALKPGGVLLIVDLQPHAIEEFREKMGHRWMGFSAEPLTAWLAAAGFVDVRWHALPARQARVPGQTAAVPDLFTLRAVRGPPTDVNSQNN